MYFYSVPCSVLTDMIICTEISVLLFGFSCILISESRGLIDHKNHIVRKGLIDVLYVKVTLSLCSDN